MVETFASMKMNWKTVRLGDVAKTSSVERPIAALVIIMEEKFHG